VRLPWIKKRKKEKKVFHLSSKDLGFVCAGY